MDEEENLFPAYSLSLCVYRRYFAASLSHSLSISIARKHLTLRVVTSDFSFSFAVTRSHLRLETEEEEKKNNSTPIFRSFYLARKKSLFILKLRKKKERERERISRMEQLGILCIDAVPLCLMA